ncbi:hypothetical protein LOAG_06960 [Loa loa]|uniref:Uncharacterized protein n=1 Tax=Loa loa TaxID=7209 RepID=A0A1S0TWU1_LOALO|nr:hypothetical protein LOAG_06960 [Loa loa]EFO21523.1 hypothetical protein LOAG_06960 [Loa loa]
MLSFVVTKCLITLTIIIILSVVKTDAQVFVRTIGSFNRNFAGGNSLNNNGNAIQRFSDGGSGRKRSRPRQSTQAPLRLRPQALGFLFKKLFQKRGKMYLGLNMLETIFNFLKLRTKKAKCVGQRVLKAE